MRDFASFHTAHVLEPERGIPLRQTLARPTTGDYWDYATQIPMLSPRLPILEPAPLTPPDAATWLLSSATGARLARRLLDALPAALTWLIVLSPLWAGFFLPTPFAIAVLAFDCYWVYLSYSTAIRAYLAHRRVQADAQIDWQKRFRAAQVFHRTFHRWEDVRHIVVIPNYREDEEILARTLTSLAKQQNAAQVLVVLAMEEREAGAAEKAARLTARFGDRLEIATTMHPGGLAGEVAGKSANEAWAARWARRELIDEQGWDLYATTISSCDADTVFHPAYFSLLTYKFATDPHRYRRFWQSPILLVNNIWDSPAPLRVASALSDAHILSNTVKGNRMMFPQSTYSLSLKMADDVGYWDTHVIPEDWHMFLKCFFAFRGEVHVEPLHLPTGNDAVLTSGYLQTLKMAYVQHKRHAWGSSDVSYAIVQAVAHPEISLPHKARRVAALVGNHLIWATHWFILSLGWIMPHVIAHVLGAGHSPVWLPAAARVVLWACMVPYLSMFVLSRKLRPAKPAGWTWRNQCWDIAWWFLLPVTSFIFGTLPALDAQTRLALGCRLEYRVTEKRAQPMHGQAAPSVK